MTQLKVESFVNLLPNQVCAQLPQVCGEFSIDDSVGELKWTEVDPSYSFANFGIAEFDLEVLRRESHFARYFDEGAISCF